MIRKLQPFFRVAVIMGLSVCLVALAQDAWAQRRGGGGRPRPHVSRQGPAPGGSFNSRREPGSARRDERPAAAPSARREARPERMDRPRVEDTERGRGREMDDRREDARRDRRDDDRLNSREDRVEDRRDYYDDRRDNYQDRRRVARGGRYSAVWWTSNSCSQTVVVVVDGYSYYQCNDTWFSRTYYGGEVTYTVTNAPPGY